MRDLLDRIAGSGCHALGAVLHLGAGMGADLAHYLRLQADKIMLVEANPELTDKLRGVVRGLEQVEVVGAAVAAAEGEAIFWVLNNPRESSLHRPEHLLDRYPNISVRSDIRVQATTLARLVERLDPATARENLLVMELQGAEVSVLSSTAPEILHKFSWIAVRASAEALYEGGARLEEVDAILRKSTFLPVAPAQPGGAQPYQEVLYHRDSPRIELQALRKLLDERQAQIEQLTMAYQEHEWVSRERLGHIEQLTQALDQQSHLAAERESRIADLVRGHQEHARVSQERQAQVERLMQELEKQVNLAAERAAQITDLTRAYQEHARVSQERQAQVERLMQELEKQVNIAAERAAQIADLTRGYQEHERVSKERLAHIEHLTRGNQEHERMSKERLAHIERLTKALEEQTGRIATLENDKHELDYRQQLLDDEMVKAEAQIELIKDVLLHEKAF